MPSRLLRPEQRAGLRDGSDALDLIRFDFYWLSDRSVVSCLQYGHVSDGVWEQNVSLECTTSTFRTHSTFGASANGRPYSLDSSPQVFKLDYVSRTNLHKSYPPHHIRIWGSSANLRLEAVCSFTTQSQILRHFRLANLQTVYQTCRRRVQRSTCTLRHSTRHWSRVVSFPLYSYLRTGAYDVIILHIFHHSVPSLDRDGARVHHARYFVNDLLYSSRVLRV